MDTYNRCWIILLPEKKNHITWYFFFLILIFFSLIILFFSAEQDHFIWSFLKDMNGLKNSMWHALAWQ